MPEKILVTGASGFIGRHLVKALLGQGQTVRCLVHRPCDRDRLKEFDVEILQGDIRDPDVQRRALENIEVVFHLAAHVRPTKAILGYNELKEAFIETNTAATISLANLSVGRVRSFIFISSIAAAGFGDPVTEMTRPQPLSDYGKSKLSAEEYLLGLFHQTGFPVRIIRPGSTYGPGNMAMRILLKFVQFGVFPSFGKGLNFHSFIHIKNLIHAMLLVQERGKNGEVYFCVDDPVALRHFAAAIASALGKRLNSFYISRSLALSVVYVKEWLEKILRVRWYPFCMDLGSTTVITASADWACSNTKIKEELGYAPRVDLQSGVNDMVHWYQENKLI